MPPTLHHWTSVSPRGPPGYRGLARLFFAMEAKPTRRSSITNRNRRTLHTPAPSTAQSHEKVVDHEQNSGYVPRASTDREQNSEDAPRNSACNRPIKTTRRSLITNNSEEASRASAVNRPKPREGPQLRIKFAGCSTRQQCRQPKATRRSSTTKRIPRTLYAPASIANRIRRTLHAP